MTRALPGLLAAALLAVGCHGTRPTAVTDSYGAWLTGPAADPVPSYFALREFDGRWWFVAPSGRRFLAVSGATTPVSGRPATADAPLPQPYLTAGLSEEPGARPVPRVAPGLPDPWDEATLPALTDAALPPAVFGDDPFCLGHLVLPGAALRRVPDVLTASPTGSAAAVRWFALRTQGTSPAAFRAEYADRLLGMMSAVLRAADESHLVFTGWYDPGATEPGVANALARWGDAVCVRLPAGPDAVRMARDAHAALTKPLLLWLTDAATGITDPAVARQTALDLLALPYVVGIDTPHPPSVAECYRRHDAGR